MAEMGQTAFRKHLAYLLVDEDLIAFSCMRTARTKNP